MALGSKIHPYQRQQMLHQPQHQFQHQRLLAPAPTTSTTISRFSSALYTTKPTTGTTSTSATTAIYKGTTLDSNNPAVVRRNARERNRVKQVNNGFVYLRQHIPQAIVADLSNGRRGIGPGAHKKLSKVDTLRMAVEYIRRLKRVIDDVDSSSETSSVRSYTSCDSSMSSSPPPSLALTSKTMAASTSDNSFYQAAQHYYPAVSYAGSFSYQQQQQNTQQHLQHQQQEQHSSIIISPAASTNSSAYSSDSYYNSTTTTSAAAAASNVIASNTYNMPHMQMKFEQSSYDDEEYAQTSTEDDEDLLDYISLWQEDNM